MNSIETKKIVLAFLGLVFLVGTMAGILGQRRQEKAAGTPTVGPATSSNPPSNAFVENLGPDPLAFNLSDTLASIAADGLANANPSGPRLDPSGLLTAAPPNLDAIVDEFLTTSTVIANLPIIEVEARIPAVKRTDLVLSSSNGKDGIRAYRSELNSVLGRLNGPKMIALLAGPPSSEAVNSAYQVFGETVLALERMSVPSSMADLHIATLRMVMHERNLFSDTADSVRDPLWTIAVHNLRMENLSLAVEEFQAAERTASVIAQQAPEEFLPWRANVAHAQVLSFDSFNFAEAVYQFVRKALVETIKDRLIHRMVQQTITWIQGGGKPQFITNWKGFLKDAGNQAIGQVLDKVAPQLCQSFGPLIRVSLAPVRTANYLDRDAYCTLDRVVQNVENFYQDFRQGGWIAYGASLEPKNNFFGAYFDASDLTAKIQAEAEAAAESESTAGGGFKDQKNCVKYEVVTPYDDCRARGGTVDACYLLQGQPGQRRCVDYQSTTPGATAGSATGQALMAPLHRIVNAQDFAALTSALVNAALNKLIKSAKGLLDPEVGSPAGKGPAVDPCARLTGADKESCRQTACEGLEGDLLDDCRKSIPPSTSTAPTFPSSNTQIGTPAASTTPTNPSTNDGGL